MIRKYLIFGKQVFLSSAQRELQTEEEVPAPIELRLPIEVYWKGDEIIRQAQYMQSAGEDSNKVKDTYTSLLVLLTPYVVLEKDRIWMLEQTKE